MGKSRLLSVRIVEADMAALELLVAAQRAAGHDVTLSKVVQKHIGNLADLIRRNAHDERREAGAYTRHHARPDQG